MNAVIYIRGAADGLDELTERLRESGIKCSRALDITRKHELPGTGGVTLAIIGDSAAITIAVMTFLATRRNTWRLKVGNDTDIRGYTCTQVEGVLVAFRPVLEKIFPAALIA